MERKREGRRSELSYFVFSKACAMVPWLRILKVTKNTRHNLKFKAVNNFELMEACTRVVPSLLAISEATKFPFQLNYTYSQVFWIKCNKLKLKYIDLYLLNNSTRYYQSNKSKTKCVPIFKSSCFYSVFLWNTKILTHPKQNKIKHWL